MSNPIKKWRDRSPKWSTTTKLVIGLTLVAIAGALMVQFKNIIGPLVISFMLSFLLYPLACYLHTKTHLSWRGSVNVVFLVLLVLLSGFLTATALAVVDQLQSLIRVVQTFVTDLPGLVENFLAEGYVLTLPIFNYSFDVGAYISQMNIDLLALSEQVLSVVQPFLGQAGGVLGTVATSALNTLVFTGFILIISYFTLAEARQGVDFFKGIELPGHVYDFGRLGRELTRIWNAFLRGQFVIFFISVLAYLILLSILGVRNTLGLAFLAGLAKFVPYVGPLLTGFTTGVVAFFQLGGNYFGLEQFTYALIVVVAAVLLDQLFDGFVAPRILGSTLGVHPAAVLVTAIIAARILGFVGLLLAAPVLASLRLLLRYTVLKMLDQNPWSEPEIQSDAAGESFAGWLQRVIGKIKEEFNKRFRKSKGKNDE
ncbi:MAG: AI-2E family transporter [Anaerolineales bacterium]|jgi:predicted PurR-regulated permease PerM